MSTTEPSTEEPPTPSFTLIDDTVKIEEETYPWWTPDTYYNVVIGEIFKSRYQVLTKLGYGTSATIWLCRDLVTRQYVALKVYICNYPSASRELAAFKRLGELTDSEGSRTVLQYLDEFSVESVDGAKHQCFVFEALGPTMELLSSAFTDKRWDCRFIPSFASYVFQALHFLHTKAHIIHCDLRTENFLARTKSDAIFHAMEAAEAREPSARKMTGDRVVYVSRGYDLILLTTVLEKWGGPVLCDFGEARLAPQDTEEPLVDNIHPWAYRAPEVLLQLPFSYPADIWNAGMMIWHMVEGKPLFRPFTDEGDVHDGIHLLLMAQLLGPMPASLLQHTPRADVREVFDENGVHEGIRDGLAHKLSIDKQERWLEGRQKELFLAFVKRCVKWDPRERASAEELLEDPFLTEGLSVRAGLVEAEKKSGGH